MRIRLLGVFAVDVDGRDVAARPWRLRKSRTLVKVARTPDANGFPAVVDWARAVTGRLGGDPKSYVNFTGEASVDQMRASYPRGTYDRLVAVKDRYDPTNLVG